MVNVLDSMTSCSIDLWLWAPSTKVQEVPPYCNGFPPPASRRLPSALSALSLTPVTSAYFSANSCLTCFVRPFAGFSSPYLCTWKLFLHFFFLDQRLFSLMCLIFPAPCLLAMPRAAEASANNLFAFPSSAKRQSLHILLIPKVSIANFPRATSSAYAELSVIASWVLLQLFTKRRPIMTMPPDVLFPVTRSPAQSLSLYQVGGPQASCQGYCRTHLGAPFKYRPSRVSCCQSHSTGFAILRHTSLTSYWMSGLSADR